MKTVAFVPIKLDSERLINKNILSFDNGEPLIKYILNTLLKVSNLDDIYVFCSDDSIISYLPEGVKFLKRDKYLDLSSTPFNDVLKEFARAVDADTYVLAHATAPFITSESIYTGIEKVTKGGFDSAFSARKMQEFFWEDNKPMNYSLNNIPRTQDLKPLYVETCGLYIFNKELILKHNRRIGINPYLLQVSSIEAIDINEKEDFDIANAVFNKIMRF